jgi:predicted fused transcriptional regulator/phosphomethylpyrimidine kinase
MPEKKYVENEKADMLMLELVSGFRELEEMDGAERLIPEVGLNMVVSKQDAKTPDDVLGLDGRVIVSRGKPRVCGEVAYGGSTYLSSVLINIAAKDQTKKAAVVVRGGRDIVEALSEMGKQVLVLPPESTGKICPVASYLEKGGEIFDVYNHPGAFGIEPTTTIVARSLREILDTLRELLKYV